jgi:hypothetical protein
MDYVFQSLVFGFAPKGPGEVVFLRPETESLPHSRFLPSAPRETLIESGGALRGSF